MLSYCKGKDNVITDALSRVSPLAVTKQGVSANSTSVAEFRKATAEDTTSGLLMSAVMNCWPESRKDCYPLLQDYWTYREEIIAKNALLF